MFILTGSHHSFVAPSILKVPDDISRLCWLYRYHFYRLRNHLEPPCEFKTRQKHLDLGHQKRNIFPSKHHVRLAAIEGHDFELHLFLDAESCPAGLKFLLPLVQSETPEAIGCFSCSKSPKKYMIIKCFERI